jgi:hypothetical protein
MRKIVCVSLKYNLTDFTIGKIYEIKYLDGVLLLPIPFGHGGIEFITDDYGKTIYYHFSVRQNFVTLKEYRKEKLKKIEKVE